MCFRTINSMYRTSYWLAMGHGEYRPALCVCVSVCTCVCMCTSTDQWDGLYQQLERGCNLRGLCIQLPATGEAGILQQLVGRLLQCLSPASGGTHIVHMCIYKVYLYRYIIYMYTCVYTHILYVLSLVDLHSTQPRGSRMRQLMLSLFTWVSCVSVFDLCVRSWIYVYKYIRGVPVYGVPMPAYQENIFSLTSGWTW